MGIASGRRRLRRAPSDTCARCHAKAGPRTPEVRNRRSPFEQLRVRPQSSPQRGSLGHIWSDGAYIQNTADTDAQEGYRVSETPTADMRQMHFITSRLRRKHRRDHPSSTLHSSCVELERLHSSYEWKDQRSLLAPSDRLRPFTRLALANPEHVGSYAA